MKSGLKSIALKAKDYQQEETWRTKKESNYYDIKFNKSSLREIALRVGIDPDILSSEKD